jgi:general L-amino acid transport system permease protein
MLPAGDDPSERNLGRGCRMAEQNVADGGTRGTSWFYDPKIRSIFFQVATVAAIVLMLAFIVTNTSQNLKARNIAQGFGFLSTTAGFDISQAPIDFPKDADYGRAIVVGLLNTLIVAVVGIICATVIGFSVGVARLSNNWVLSRLATVYVELIRNIPLLLQMFFWYFAVLAVLPGPRDSVEIKPLKVLSLPLDGLAWLPLPQSISEMFAAGSKAIGADGWVYYLNNRGLVGPSIGVGPGDAPSLGVALLVGLVIAWGLHRWAKARQVATGQAFPSLRVGLLILIAVPVLYALATGIHTSVEFPTKTRFNLAGGQRVIPELMALVVALSVYTGAFIAETVRAGILAVAHGQTEAARSLGLYPGRTLQLVVIPQAMRVIIPPLTSQYLNLTKNSSLAVAIGYPDLVYTGGTVLNQTGQAIEVISIWMLVYLGTSLITSFAMNVFNARMAIVER